MRGEIIMALTPQQVAQKVAEIGNTLRQPEEIEVFQREIDKIVEHIKLEDAVADALAEFAIIKAENKTYDLSKLLLVALGEGH
jgi:cell fate (sporulation/competence/biofilm development) regulator YmcA (YheA/YmcA/DUF963 family)